jgi:hypothetical protein
MRRRALARSRGAGERGGETRLTSRADARESARRADEPRRARALCVPARGTSPDPTRDAREAPPRDTTVSQPSTARRALPLRTATGLRNSHTTQTDRLTVESGPVHRPAARRAVCRCRVRPRRRCAPPRASDCAADVAPSRTASDHGCGAAPLDNTGSNTAHAYTTVGARGAHARRTRRLGLSAVHVGSSHARQ